MGIFGKILNKEERLKKPIVALDIGEGLIKALAIKIDEKDNSKGLITGQGIAANVPGSIAGGIIMDISQITNTCRDALVKACGENDAEMRDAVIGISSAVSRVSMANIVYRRSKPQKEITGDELRSVIKELKNRVLVKMQEEFVSASEKEAFQLLNITISEIRIDGYKVPTPLGFQGKDIAFCIVAAYAPVSYIKAINAICFDLKLNVLDIFSTPFTMSKIYQDIKNGFGGIILDVGYETTAVSIIQDGTIAGIKTFSIGGAAFTRAIARNLNLDNMSAENVKFQYCLRKLPADLDGNVGQILNNIVSLWYKGVKKTLLEFSVTELVSGKVYLTGGGCVLPEILKILNTGDLRNNLPIIEMICVNQLNLLSESGNIFSDNYIDPAEYNGSISLLSYFLNYNNGKQSLDRLLLDEITDTNAGSKHNNTK